MSRIMRRMGVFPTLFLGAALAVIGTLSMLHIVDNWWFFDVGRLDLVRSTALNRADATILLEAANNEIILAFLATVLVTVTGLVLPLAYILNKRFGHNPNQVDKSKARLAPALSNQPAVTAAQPIEIPFPRFMVTLRQSMWVGLWVAFCVWLQMNRALGIAVASLVAIFLVLFELLLQLRTRAATVADG